MAYFSAHKDDRLLQELNLHEEELNAWLNSSPANAILFIEDPVAALRAANLGIPESMLQELEETMNALAEKLGAA
ncbi:MAG: hypothetical protein ACM3SW_14240 [Actinomycetota bacterium]